MTQAAAPRSTHRSYSQVRQLRTCGWQFYLERVRRVSARPSVPAIAGVAVHTATEVVDRLLHDGQTDPDILIAEAQADADESLFGSIAHESEAGWEPSTWKRYGRKTADKPNGEDIEWFQNNGIPLSIRAYVDWRLANPDWVLAEIPGFGPGIEVPFNYYVTPGRLVRGYIDRVFTSRAQGGYYPLDIKSGRKPKTDEQLGVYKAALNEALGWNVERGYFIYGLKSGKATLTDPLDLSHWTPQRLAAVYEPASQAIEQGIYMPNPGEGCFVCSVSDHCEFALSVI